MTIKQPLWLEDLDYSATDMRRLLDLLNPYAGNIGNADLAVSQHAAGANMSVDVAAGSALIAGTTVSGQGKYLFTSDAVVNVPIAASPPSGQSRIDLIVAQIRDEDQAGGANNDGIITVVTGTAAATGSQVAPALPASSLLLATIAVGPLVTSIVTANITDGRTSIPSQKAVGGHLAATYTLTTGMATFLTTPVLAVGRWVISFGASIVVNTSEASLEIQAAAGTLSGTFEGRTSAEYDGSLNLQEDLSLDFIVNVTSPGTLVFQAKAATGANATIQSTTATSGLARATGFTATLSA